MIAMRILLVIFTLLYFYILFAGIRKSNHDVSRKPVETWAIIGREFVEFTPEEIEWRSQNV